MVPILYFTPLWAGAGASAGHNRRPAPILVVLPVCLALLALFSPPAAGAQTQDKGANSAPAVKTILQLFDELDEIDHLRSLNPLKLTPDELDKLIAAITVANAEYEKGLVALAATAIKEIQDQAHEVKQKALAGGDIPESFNTPAKKAISGYTAERAKLQLKLTAGLAASIHEILTAEQITRAIKISRQAATDQGRPTTVGTDMQWFNDYVVEVIVGYPRIVPLLQEMRAAVASGTAGGKGADTKGTGSGGSKGQGGNGR